MSTCEHNCDLSSPYLIPTGAKFQGSSSKDEEISTPNPELIENEAFIDA